jgi:hypothetical protein
MKIPVAITYANLEPSRNIDASIERWAQRLDVFRDRLIEVRVRVAAIRRWTLARCYRVVVEMRVAGTRTWLGLGAGTPHLHDDVYVAIGDAFRDVYRTLQQDARSVQHVALPVPDVRRRAILAMGS